MNQRCFVIPHRWGWENKGVDDALADANLLDAEQDAAFLMGAAWMAGGLAVCAFLDDLARLRASPPPVSSDGVKNILNQIEAFSTAMRRTWGEP